MKRQEQDTPFDYAQTQDSRPPAPPVPPVAGVTSVAEFPPVPDPSDPEVPAESPSLTKEDLQVLEAKVEYLQDFIARKFSADRQKQELYDRLYEHMNGMKEGFHWEIIKPLVNAVIAAVDANESLVPRTAELDMLKQGLSDILLPYGVERMDVQPGDLFDVKAHMALRTVELPGTAPGEVIQVAKAGYRRGTLVLRPAQVTVTR